MFQSNSFCNKDNSPRLASVRAGNVIGGGDWSGDRLIPDILKAFENSKEVIVRNPLSIRPWQHVLEPLSGYLQLAQKMYFEDNSFSQAWNFGPNDKDCKSVEWILNKITRCWGEDSSWKLDSENNPHEAVFLKLDCNKANKELKWFPRWGLEKTLDLIVDWHKKWMLNKNIKLECISQINEFNKKII